MKDFFTKRPLSWSAISSFTYSPDQWYSRYILNEKQPESAEMTFGKRVADSFQTKEPLAPVTLYPIIEQPLNVVFNDIHMTGWIDTYDPVTHNFREFKTSKKPWDQKRANEHGQLQMYALMLYITHKVRPEDYTIHLDNILTKSNGDFSIDFVKPIQVYSFQVKLHMSDILRFGQKINNTVKQMIDFCKKKSIM